LGIVMEHGGRYKGFNKTSSDEVLRAGQQILGELGREDRVAIWEYADSAHQVADFTTTPRPARPALHERWRARLL
jgi:hypothetical protein